MIALEEYKNYLINYYRYAYDSDEEHKEKRQNYLNTMYKDEYLKKIINDTYSLFEEVINNCTESYYFVNLTDKATDYISLNLVGGWYSDRLFLLEDGRIVSAYVLNSAFNNKATIFIHEEEYSLESDMKGLYSWYINYRLLIQNIPKEIKGNSRIKK